MAAQRPPDLAPAIRASAGALPLRDAAVDAAMAILTVHHWDADQERGVRELRRVARGPVVVLTYDPRVSAATWLMADYLPEVAALDDAIFRPRAAGGLARRRGRRRARADPARHARLDARLVLGAPRAGPRSDGARRHVGLRPDGAGGRQRCVAAVRRDLASGAWDARHGHLRGLDAYDAGLRLIVAR